MQEESLTKHGTHDTYVIRTYNSNEDWITSTRKDRISVLSGNGWVIQYQGDIRLNPLHVGESFLIPRDTEYKIVNRDNIEERLVLKVEFI